MSPEQIRIAIAGLQALLPENEIRLTVAEVVQRYMGSVEFQSLQQNWAEEIRLRLHIVPGLGAENVMALTSERIATYRNERKAQAGNGLAPTKPATRNREVRRLSAALNWAVEAKLIPSNPLAGVPMEIEDNLRQTCPTPAEINRILLATKSARLRAMIAVGFWSGLRRGEILTLEASQLSWDDGLIVLQRRKTKGKKERVTIFPDRASDLVRAYLDSAPTGKWLFSTDTGNQISPRNFLRDFQRTVDRSGVQAAPGERMVLHDLRSGFVGRQLELGTPEKTIMEMTGHSTHAAFDRYVRVQKRWLLDARERTELADLNGAMRKPPARAGIGRAKEKATGHERIPLTATGHS